MKKPSTGAQQVNVRTPVPYNSMPRLPHERDAVAQTPSPQRREKMKQAYDDIERGLVDTDMHGIRGVETVRREGAPAPVVKGRENRRKN